MNAQGIVYWNRGAEQLYGYSRTEARGRTTHELLKTQLTGGVTHLEGSLARFGIWVGELRHTTSRGNSVLVEGRLTLMSQHNGRWLVLEVNRDVTDRKVAEAASRVMQCQLAELRAKQGGDRDRQTTPG
jgi:two-component system, chemotaxis family, CheB/CheR fusion protein